MVNKKSKIPPRLHICDDFKIVDDSGKTYYPHAGEKVWFKRKTSVGDMSKLMKFQDLTQRQQLEQELGEISMDTSLQLASAFEELIHMLIASIVKWDWTDDDGELYPEKPDFEVLSNMSIEEIVYLVGAQVARVNPTDEERKKG